MRTLALLLLLLPATAIAKETTARFRYTGWKCAACAGKVEKAARAIKGVKKATATLDVVTLTYDDTKTTTDALSKSLVLDGFTFTPVVTGTSS